jgi:hypothetical protein
MFLPRRSKVDSVFSCVGGNGSGILNTGKKPTYYNTFKLSPDKKPKMPEIKKKMQNILNGMVTFLILENRLLANRK